MLTAPRIAEEQGFSLPKDKNQEFRDAGLEGILQFFQTSLLKSQMDHLENELSLMFYHPLGSIFSLTTWEVSMDVIPTLHKRRLKPTHALTCLRVNNEFMVA